MAKALFVPTQQSLDGSHASQEPAGGELSCVNPSDFTPLHAVHHLSDLTEYFLYLPEGAWMAPTSNCWALARRSIRSAWTG